jgi:predicted permease
LLLFGLGAIPGVALARWGVVVIKGLFAEGRRGITLDANFNWRILAFTALVTLVAGLVSGLFPACRAFRTDPEQAMREGQPRTGESRGSAAMTRALVGFQVALSLVLLVGAVTFVRTLMNLRNIDPGFQNEKALTMSIEVPGAYVRAGKSLTIWTRALEAVREVPGVRSAALSTFIPLSGRDRAPQVSIRGYQPASTQDSIIHVNPVSEGYFESLGIRLLRGRLFTNRDTAGAPQVAVINESAARKYFAGQDPIGQSLEFDRKGTSGGRLYQIVGVVRDTKHFNLREPSPPFAFLPIRQPRDTEGRMSLIVASSTPDAPMTLMQPIRAALAKVDSAILISEVITVGRQLDSTLLTERLLSGLSGVFGALALVLAAIGLYGVLSYRIGQQRQSIGIRMALGASPSSMGFSVVRQSGLVVAVGILAGLPFAILAARTADSMLWGVGAGDPLIYVAAVALLGLAGLASAWIPARRASAIEPAEALRHG